jgi:uncharacterized membrane protein YphA (DoxX/SURF4 family)
MLNIFPEALTYGLAGPFILRLVLGIVIFDLGLLTFGKEKNRWASLFEIMKLRPGKFFAQIIGFLKIVSGIMIIIGLHTQIAALVISTISLLEIWIEYREPIFLRRNIVFYLLIFAISLSLFFTGAGFFAFDFPL